MAKGARAKGRTVVEKTGGRDVAKSRAAVTGRRLSPDAKIMRGSSDKAVEMVLGPGKFEIIDLSVELRQYREALIAQIDKIVVPGVLARIAKGAATVAPVDLARRMLSVAPAPAPVNRMAEQVGPEFYDTNGVSVVLAEPGEDPVSKQAVEHRRKRRTILALRTSDGRWIYPTWQFRDREVIPGLAEVLAAFDRDKQPFSTWSIGTWLTTPLEDLDGSTAVEWLGADADRDHLVSVARRTAARWAA